MDVLRSDVTVFEGITQFSAKPARIELHEDRFRLIKKDPETLYPVETVMDVPLSELRVGGSLAMLTFRTGELKRRVDFSFASRAALLAGPVGVGLSGGLISASGIHEWVAAFRARGVKVRYLSFWAIVGISVGAVAAIIVLSLIGYAISRLL